MNNPDDPVADGSDDVAAGSTGEHHPTGLSTADSQLLAAAQQRRPRALGRLISAIENSALKPPLHQGSRIDALRGVLGAPGSAQVVGVTGPPGVGKSSLSSALVAAWRATGAQVAVLAVDPSSPVSGGALLGDRVRMQHHATDPGVYIRSMSSRGHLGGLSVAAYDVVRVLEWAGFDVVLVETVGVGQSEVEVAQLCDTTVVALAPGMGDGVQAAKAGVLEVADIFVVNKADHEGAQALVRDLRTNVSMGHRGTWKPPIVTTVATQAEGIEEVVAQVGAHRAHSLASGEWERRRRDQVAEQITGVAFSLVRRYSADQPDELRTLVDQVSRGELDTHRAATALVRGWLDPDSAGGNVSTPG